jgi:FMN phosphatase YigB (HAD superfamily)
MHVTARTNQHILLRAFLTRQKKEEEDSIKDEFRRVFLTQESDADIVGHLIKNGVNLPDACKMQLSSINDGVRATMRSLVEKEVASVKPFDDIDTLLQRLESDFDLILLSNLATPFKSPFLDAGYGRHFKACIFSCDVGETKPSKELFEMALSHCDGFEKGRVLMVGDKMHTDGAGAEAVGIHYFKSHGKPTFLKEFTQLMMP